MDHVILDSQVLTSLMMCPCLTDLRFNLNIVPIGGKSNSLECGSIVHAFLETYYGNLAKGINKVKATEEGLIQAKLYITGCPVCKDISNGIRPPCGHRPGEYVGVKNTPRESGKQNLGFGERDYTGWEWVLETINQYVDFYKDDFWKS